MSIKINKTYRFLNVFMFAMAFISLQIFSANLAYCSPPDSPSEHKQEKSAFNPKLLTSPYASWGIDPKNKKSAINLLSAWKHFKYKKEIVVAVIDTGIDPKHPFLTNNILYSSQKRRSIGSKYSSSSYGIDFSKGALNHFTPTDSHGHGTHVSGIIKSIFPKVKILPLKYYNPNASGQDNLNSTIKALRYAVNSNVDVINYSGGGPEPALEELRILRQAEKKGILVIAAAGNEESNIDENKNAYYPASYNLSNIITVTAHDKNVNLLPSSNWGKKTVDISAPGHRIRSSLPHSRAGYLTGTSQATAFVTGVVAMIKSEYPQLSAATMKMIIQKSAYKENSLLGKCRSGGRLDASKALDLARKIASKYKRTLAQTKPIKRKLGRIIYHNVAN